MDLNTQLITYVSICLILFDWFLFYSCLIRTRLKCVGLYIVYAFRKVQSSNRRAEEARWPGTATHLGNKNKNPLDWMLKPIIICEPLGWMLKPITVRESLGWMLKPITVCEPLAWMVKPIRLWTTGLNGKTYQFVNHWVEWWNLSVDCFRHCSSYLSLPYFEDIRYSGVTRLEPLRFMWCTESLEQYTFI